MDTFKKTQEDIKQGLQIIERDGDLTGVTFLTPVSWCILTSFSMKNIDFNLKNYSENIRSFWQRFWFADLTGRMKIAEQNKRKNDAVIEMNQLKNEFACDRAASDIAKICEKYRKNFDDDFFRNLEKIIMEITNNSIQHSEWVCYICWMYYKNSNTIQIAIVDSGQWIQASLKELYGDLDAQSAIQKAMEPHITRNPYTTKVKPYGGNGSSNAGLGLPLSSKIIVCNSWEFFIASWDAMYAISGNNDDENFLEDNQKLSSYWNGTIVVFNLKTDKEQTQTMEAIYATFAHNSKNTQNFDSFLNFW